MSEDVNSDSADQMPPPKPEVDPDESPFAVPPLSGLPFGKDSEEARAIAAVIEEAERERSAASDRA